MYSRNNINTIEKLTLALRDFGFFGEWDGAKLEYKGDSMVGCRTCDCHFYWDHKPVLKNNGKTMEFDTISLVSKDEHEKLMEELGSKEPLLVYKFTKFINSVTGETEYVLNKDSYLLLGEFSFAEKLEFGKGRVTFNVMPHRNLHLYITVDEDGNRIRHAEKIHQDEPVNSAGIDRSWFDNKSILENDGEYHYEEHLGNIRDYLQRYLDK